MSEVTYYLIHGSSRKAIGLVTWRGQNTAFFGFGTAGSWIFAAEATKTRVIEFAALQANAFDRIKVSRIAN